MTEQTESSLTDPPAGEPVAGGVPLQKGPQEGRGSRHTPWLEGADVTVAPTPVLRVSGLGIEFRSSAGGRAGRGPATTAVSDVSFEVFGSEVLAVVGESGSGKSVTARAVLGLLPDTATVTGSIVLRGTEVVGADDAVLQPLRGRGAAMVFQEPQSALNPVRTAGWQIGEALRAHRNGRDRLDRAARRRRAVELLELVGIPEPQRRVDAYPHQLSGGQKQRVVIALALANDPALLIADEPTTALDVTVQAEILRLLDSLRRRLGTAILLITHNMGVVADIADRVLVMQGGRLVEKGEVYSLFADPTAEYTRDLLAAVPTLPVDLPGVPGRPETDASRLRRPARVADRSPVPTAEATSAERAGIDDPAPAPRGGAAQTALRLEAVTATYPGRLGSREFRALDRVGFTIERGEVVGVVGESGSGKTTVARVVAGRLPVAAGSLRVDGVDPATLSGSALRAARGRVGIVHQDPATSLNPLRSVGDSIAEPLLIHGRATGREAGERVEELLESVRLPRAYRHRRPAELSGGQRQRVALARALSLHPTLLIADEPTSALDVSVQAVVLELLTDLQAEHGFACLFISHDLAVVHQFADRVVVLRAGRVVEQGDVDVVLRTPAEDYTRRLLAAVPLPDPVAQRARRVADREIVASDDRDAVASPAG